MSDWVGDYIVFVFFVGTLVICVYWLYKDEIWSLLKRLFSRK